MGKPQRIRSRIMIFIYSNCDASISIMEHLKKRFKVKNDEEWRYIVKTEHRATGQIDTVVFIELMFDPDVSLSKLNFKHNNEVITPSIHCWSDKEILLRYMLTFYDVSQLNSTLITNLSHPELEEKAIVMKVPLNSTSATVLLNDISTLPNDSVPVNSDVQQSRKEKPLITNKQLERFNKYYLKFTHILESSQPTAETIKELERNLRNLINYRSQYTISKETEACIKNCQLKLKEFRKNI